MIQTNALRIELKPQDGCGWAWTLQVADLLAQCLSNDFAVCQEELEIVATHSAWRIFSDIAYDLCLPPSQRCG